MKKILKSILSFISRFANCMKLVDSEAHKRRNNLKVFAIEEYKVSDRVEVLSAIIKFGITLVKDTSTPSKALIGDLKAVLIGRNMTICRGKGAYFAGNITGSEGFRKELQDPWNQIQHATAGIVIAFQYGKLAEIIVKILETEVQDDLLYDATFPLGDTLNDENYTELAEKLKKAIGS